MNCNLDMDFKKPFNFEEVWRNWGIEMGKKENITLLEYHVSDSVL